MPSPQNQSLPHLSNLTKLGSIVHSIALRSLICGYWWQGAAVEIKLGSTLILVKVSLVIGPWTSAATSSLANILCGRLIVMQFNSSLHMTVPTQPSSACKCVWCVGMLTLSIEMIITLLTQTTGRNWAQTFALIHYSKIPRANPVTS